MKERRSFLCFKTTASFWDITKPEIAVEVGVRISQMTFAAENDRTHGPKSSREKSACVCVCALRANLVDSCGEHNTCVCFTSVACWCSFFFYQCVFLCFFCFFFNYWLTFCIPLRKAGSETLRTIFKTCARELCSRMCLVSFGVCLTLFDALFERQGSRQERFKRRHV